MARSTSPAVSRRWLALELRRLREAMGLAQREVGKRCGFSGARLSYLETGTQAVIDDDLDQLLPLYEVPSERRPEYYETAAHAREKGWWERYDDRSRADFLVPYVGLEQGASHIRVVESALVPGLLQTPDYAAVAVATDVVPRPPQQIRSVVDFRIARQRFLDDGHAPTMHVVIDESVLHRVVGGRSTMIAQLERLAERALYPNIDLQVFPFEAGASPALLNPYRMLDFDEQQGPSVVYVERLGHGTILEDPPTLDAHALMFSGVTSLALEANESLDLIRSTTRVYRRNAATLI